jgi:formiminotetrahydrofolate cyclodeaminase
MTGDGGQPAGRQALGAWLAELGSAAPVPGGGAAAAVTAALAAALVEMVCNLTLGKPSYAEHEQEITGIRARAGGLREAALGQADADAAAFSELMASFRLPRDTEADSAARTAAIQAATVAAASVPLDIAATAAAVTGLAARLPGRSNRNVLSDVGVAALCAAAAIDAAALNVDINLKTLADAGTAAAMREQLGQHRAAAGEARRLAADVAREVAR